VGEMEFGGVRSCVGNLEGGAWPASASRGLGMSTESDLAAKAAAMLEMGSTAVTDMLAVKKWDELSVVAAGESAERVAITSD
jgi:hypothetical protein